MTVMASANSDGEAGGSTCIPSQYGTYELGINWTVLAKWQMLGILDKLTDKLIIVKIFYIEK